MTLAASPWLVDVGRSLREALLMAWATLWPIVLGFGLSGFVQAFVPRSSVERFLGNRRAGAVARASALGMASSSCSYAASAMARSLFAEGADFVTAMVFMVASTNLVIELGIVLVVLLGWPFLAGQFVGGVVMVVVVTVVGGAVLRGPLVERARRDARGVSGAGHDHVHDHSHGDGGTADHGSAGTGGAGRARVMARLRDPDRWRAAAGYAVADLSMLRREILVGFTVAGFLAVLVPVAAWHAAFLHGHGTVATIENALVGPLVAAASFVCSIGNVPLAAALWSGGISFGGVVAFLFADLLSVPLLLVYRRQYGTALTVRLFGVLWVASSVAGLATGTLFDAAGIVPAPHVHRLPVESFAWNYTTVLDIVALASLALWIHASRRRGRLGQGGPDDVHRDGPTPPGHAVEGRRSGPAR